MKDSPEQWEQKFREDAEADDFNLFRNLLQKLEMPDSPELLLKGTLMVIPACCAYKNIDNHPIREFLRHQSYHPIWSKDTEYTLIFNLFGMAYARILTSAELTSVDLADLFDHPWHEFKKSGYSYFWLTRTDGHALTVEEIDQIDKTVTEDLYHDYSEEEIAFDFDESAIKGCLKVQVQNL